MKKITATSVLWLLAVTLFSLAAHAASTWQPDVLGNGFEMRYVDQPDDYAGKVRSTIVRKLANHNSIAAEKFQTTTDAPSALPQHAPRMAVLYVHGYNDYFFQAEMADSFVTHGYDFYAVDLRKYGRSYMPSQRRFEARSLREYFPDIDSAMVEIKHSQVDSVILIGHSTGGLISAYYMSQTHQPMVKALILNSPFLDWNLGKQECLIPLLTWWGRWFPNTKIKQGMSHAYAESLLADYHGRWHYNTDWKLMQSPPVTCGWIRAITLAQRALRDGKSHIDAPILLMYSARSAHGSAWTPNHQSADAVLDVADIHRYGCMLGPNVTCMKVYGGLHDLVLSSPEVTAALYPRIFTWLDSRGF